MGTEAKLKDAEAKFEKAVGTECNGGKNALTRLFPSHAPTHAPIHPCSARRCSAGTCADFGGGNSVGCLSREILVVASTLFIAIAIAIACHLRLAFCSCADGRDP